MNHPPPFRVIIAGSRGFADFAALCAYADKVLARKAQERQIIIVSGHCQGADLMGEQYARMRGYGTDLHPADWTRYGRAAGPPVCRCEFLDTKKVEAYASTALFVVLLFFFLIKTPISKEFCSRTHLFRLFEVSIIKLLFDFEEGNQPVSVRIYRHTSIVEPFFILGMELFNIRLTVSKGNALLLQQKLPLNHRLRLSLFTHIVSPSPFRGGPLLID